MALLPELGIVKELAGDLIKRWKDDGETSAEEPDVIEGLKGLIMNEFIDGDILSEVTGDLRVRLAIRAIKLVQEKFGLKIDGVIGSKTNSRLKNSHGCNEPKAEKPNVPPPQERNGIMLLEYHILDETLPPEMDLDVAEDSIADAWQLWTLSPLLTRRFLVAKKTQDKASANILIQFGRMDGAGSKLAEAHVGGPGFLKSQQLTLTFDSAENFDDDDEKFTLTACHEIGHLLGLNHFQTPGHIMSAFFNRSIKAPTPDDIKEFKRAWGQS